MDLDKIQKNLKNISTKTDKENFIYDFLLAFDQPKSTISRLKKGDYNQSKLQNEVIWRKKIFFKIIKSNQDVHYSIDELSKNESIKKNEVRFLIVTDFKTLLSKDIKTGDTLDIELSKLHECISFFLPLMGKEKFAYEKENEADIKAANNLGKLYDQIILDNRDSIFDTEKKDLNIFFSRLLFLYYADDSEIFEKNLFLKTISDFTSSDGSDLEKFFNELFERLNSNNPEQKQFYFKKFPYVNGRLFEKKIKLPIFTKKSREIIIFSASLDWKNINPDILGSMLQSIVSKEERDEVEMHYTSVPNILKVLNPLFLDELNSKLDEAGDDEKKLRKILDYIYNIKIFDPACGSGNFLIISYISLCQIEIKIFRILNRINPDAWRLSTTGISINQFYGIEISHFASETAKLSMWIAEHQMNLNFKEVFGLIKPSLPLSTNEKIINTNAATIDWSNHCFKEKKTKHIYLVGNPPYKGFARQSDQQKKDMELVLKKINGYKRFDYISLWIFKSINYILLNKISTSGLVSTNSVCQGEHINLFWKPLLNEVEISFAVKPFKWGNNAKNNATVSCIIIGLSIKNSKEKKIYDDGYVEKCKIINPYLTSSEITHIEKKEKPFCIDFNKMIVGNMPYDGGFLKFNDHDYQNLINKNPNIKFFFRKLTGGAEFINGRKRWVLWLNNNNLKEALEFNEVKSIIENVRKFREKGGGVARGLANKSHQFRFVNEAKKNLILVPYTSSKSRYYFPIGFLDKEFVVLNSAKVIYDPEPYILGILSSRTFFLWVLHASGKMGNDSIRFSSSLCYNTFPILNVPVNFKKEINEVSFKIIDEREKYSDMTINDLYGTNMPKSLMEIHKVNDDLIDELIFQKKNISEKEKLKLLFNKYNDLRSKEKLI